MLSAQVSLIVSGVSAVAVKETGIDGAAAVVLEAYPTSADRPNAFVAATQ